MHSLIRFKKYLTWILSAFVGTCLAFVGTSLHYLFGDDGPVSLNSMVDHVKLPKAHADTVAGGSDSDDGGYTPDDYGSTDGGDSGGSGSDGLY